MKNKKKCIVLIVIILLISIFSVLRITYSKYVITKGEEAFYIDKIMDDKIKPTITVDDPNSDDPEKPPVNLTDEEYYTNEDVKVDFDDNIKVATSKYWYNEDEKKFEGEGKDFEDGTVFTEEGWYKIVVTDIFDNTNTVIILIDKTAPIIYADSTNTTTENAIRNTYSQDNQKDFKQWFISDVNISEYDKYGIKHTDYKTNEEEQNFDHIELSKEQDDINAGKSDLWIFEQEGYYFIVSTDLCGNTSSLIIGVDKTAPVATGIPEAGKSNQDLTINFNDNLSGMDISQIAYNGKENDFSSSEYRKILEDTVLCEDGYYHLVLTDVAGNSTEYKFMIDETPPVISGIEDNGYSKEDVTIDFYDELSGIADAIYYESDTKDFSLSEGKPLTNHTTFTEDGYYHIVVTDNTGNVSEITFLIDKSNDEEPPEIALSVIETDTEDPASAILESYRTLTGYKLAYKATDTYSGVAKVEIYLGDELYQTEEWTDEGYYRTGNYTLDAKDVAFYETGYIIAYDFYNNQLKSEVITINNNQIFSKEDMNTLSDLVNNGTTFENDIIYLMNDVDLENENFTPIGKSETTSFKGTFEGNGYTISNLNVNESKDYVGLFGYNKGIIQNINVIGNVENTGNYTGGIAGYNDNTIQYAVSQIEVKTNGEHQYTGGITGYNAGTIYYGFSTKTIEGNDYVGGIAGYTENNISYVGNFGKVSGKNQYIAGITGYNDGTKLYNAFNKGAIKGNTYVGGIAGWNNTGSEVLACYNVNQITKDNNNSNYLGGLIGYNAGTLIKNAYNVGMVDKATYSGAIIGYNTGKVNWVYAGKNTSSDLCGYNNSSILCSCLVDNVQLTDPAYVPSGYKPVETFEDALNGCGIGITTHGHTEENPTGEETANLTREFLVDSFDFNIENTYCLNFESFILENSINKNCNNLMYIYYSNSSEDVIVKTKQKEIPSTTYKLKNDIEKVNTLSNNYLEVQEMKDNKIVENTLNNAKSISEVDTTENIVTENNSIYTRTYTNIFLTNKSVEVDVTDDRKVDEAYYYYSATDDFSESMGVSFGTHKAFYDNGYYKIVAYDTTGNEAIYDYFCINTDYTDEEKPTATFSVSKPSSTSRTDATYTIDINATDESSGIKQIDLYLYDEDLDKYYIYKTWNYNSWFELNKKETIQIPVSELPFYTEAYVVVTDQYNNTTQTEKQYVNTELIYDAWDLKQLSLLSNASTTCSLVQEKSIYLVNDIDLSSVCSESIGSWTPAFWANNFKGIFCGNDYTISNLYINTDSNYAGVFGKNDGMIEHLTVDGSVTSSANYVGGIVGYNYTNGVIKFCKNEASIISTGNSSTFVGGIAGSNTGSTHVKNNGLYAVQNTGSILATGTKPKHIGGITGFSRNSIYYAANNGNIEIPNNSSCAIVGGICGAMWDENGENAIYIWKSYNTGAIHTRMSLSSNQRSTGKTSLASYATSGIFGGGNVLACCAGTYNSGNLETTYGSINQISASNVFGNNVYVSGGRNLTRYGISKETMFFTKAHTETDSVSYLLNSDKTLTTNDYNFVTNPAYNDGYPYLDWQEISASTFSMTLNEKIAINEELPMEVNEAIVEDILVLDELNVNNVENEDNGEKEFSPILPLNVSEDSVFLSCEYGNRIHPITGESSFHTGIDLTSYENANAEVTSVADGIVSEVIKGDSVWGNAIEIKHTLNDGSEIYTFYAHLQDDSIRLNVGDTVKSGEKIGIMGMTGYATGNHLHFEIRTATGYGNDIDPTPYIFKQDLTNTVTEDAKDETASEEIINDVKQEM